MGPPQVQVFPDVACFSDLMQVERTGNASDALGTS